MNLIAMLVGWGVPQRFAKPVLIAGLFALALLGAWGVKALYDRSVINHHEQKLEQRAKPATDKAATERANDTITNTKHEEELHHAVHSVPDAPSAGPSHQLACARLRHAHKSSPACR